MRRRPATLSGKVLNCAIWIPDEYGGWKCGAYGRVCEGDKCAPLPDPKKKQVKVCITRQQVYSLFLEKDVTRCKKYAPACSGQACMPMTLPYPKEASEKTMPAPAEIRSIAEWMAQEFNVEAFEKEPYLARQILERGGIRPYKTPTGLDKPVEKEEYKTLPLFLRNKQGMPLDEMAAEMGYEYTNDLVEDIQKAYPPKAKGAWKKKKRKEASDFIDAAYSYIEAQMVEGQWG